jgi:NTE family protein
MGDKVILTGSPRPRVALALQGGGAHGAYGWGVLDRLLEADCFDIDAISGTSAGAMNGAMLASGLAEGPEAARALLGRFWNRTVGAATWSPLIPSPVDRLFGNGDLSFSPGYQVMGYMARMMSPSQINPLFNPLEVNPLRDVLSSVLDIKKLNSADAPKLYVAAVHVTSGRLRIFETPEMTLDALLASACLPFMSEPVKIDGAGYWDGGYLANPALSPLITPIAAGKARDIIVVQVTPFERHEEPRTYTDIVDRISEISCNGALLRELEAIEQHNALIDSGKLNAKDVARVRLHVISPDESMGRLTASSKLNAERGFVEKLFKLGRQAADQWLERNRLHVGNRSSFKLDQPLLHDATELGKRGFAA